MSTVTLDTANANFESNETYSLGESAYSHNETAGALSPISWVTYFFPKTVTSFLSTIHPENDLTFTAQLKNIREKTNFSFPVTYVDSKEDFHLHGGMFSFNNFVLALPFKHIKSNPEVVEFFIARAFRGYNSQFPSLMVRTFSSREILKIDFLAIITLGLSFLRLAVYQQDEAVTSLVGFEKSISAIKKYKVIRQENNKAWRQGSFLAQLVAYLTLDKENNDYFNIFTPCIDKRIKNLETRWIQIQTV